MLSKLLTVTYRPSQRSGLTQTLPFAMIFLRWGMVVSTVSITVATLVIGIGTVSNNNQIAVDPFSRYAAIMPGQPTAALANFDCRDVYLPESLKQRRCTISPASRYLASINVISQGLAITELGIALKSVRIGDLFTLWGRPSRILKETRRFIVQWDNGAVAYVPHDNRDVLNLYWTASLVTFRIASM